MEKPLSRALAGVAFRVRSCRTNAREQLMKVKTNVKSGACNFAPGCPCGNHPWIKPGGGGR
jgi:hypothetical protein